MIRLRHLLCLVSPTGPPVALRQGLHLAAACGASLSVMPMGTGTRAGVLDALRDARHQAGEEAASVHTEVLPAPDEPLPEAVQAYVQNEDPDLLVADSPSRPGGRSLLPNEDVRGLIEGGDTPLFLADRCRPPASVQRLLVPTDLSDRSLKTINCAVELAACYEASVVLLHVLDTSPYVALTPVDRLSLGSTTLPEHRARRRLRQFVRERPQNDVSIRTRLAFGDPADHIVRTVEEEATDVLVLSSREGEAPGERGLGPVADRVLRRVTGPVVLLPDAGTSLLGKAETGTDARMKRD
jgi:nucleotide-binding universal stress UspA family protein